jgi:protein dithiol oxidoreductase (disulfide-forming)
MRIVKPLFAAVILFAFLSAANAAALQKGVHYDVIDPAQPTDVANKVEVIEFFSYGCPHCYHLEPSINPWIKKLPKDVNFLRAPLAGGQWAPSAKLFYTLDALGVEDKLHGEVFTSIHGDKSLTGTDETAMPGWATKKGLDQKKFSDIYKSFAIQTKVQRALQMAASHKVTGVPAIVVDGRYLVLNNTIQNYDDLLAITDQVIEMARADKNGKK